MGIMLSTPYVCSFREVKDFQLRSSTQVGDFLEKVWWIFWEERGFESSRAREHENAPSEQSPKREAEATRRENTGHESPADEGELADAWC